MLEHYTVQFLVQMKGINLDVLILQHTKLNKFNMGGLVIKILRKARVYFQFEKKMFGTKVSKSNFFALKINQKPGQPKSIIVSEGRVLRGTIKKSILEP